MGVITRIKDEFAKKQMKKGSVRKKAFKNSLNVYYSVSKEVKLIDKEINEAKKFLESVRKEGKNVNNYSSTENKARYLSDLSSSTTGLVATINELKERRKGLLKKQKELSKIINASEKGKNTTINFENKKIKLYFKE